METEKKWSNRKSCLMMIIYTIITWSIIIGLIITLSGCGPSPEEKLLEENPTYTTTINPECDCDSLNATIQLLEQKLISQEQEKKEPKIWDAFETGLVQGTVIQTDCSNHNRENQNARDNYITIKKSDGTSTIIRDVDEDVFLNVNVGDIIR